MSPALAGCIQASPALAGCILAGPSLSTASPDPLSLLSVYISSYVDLNPSKSESRNRKWGGGRRPASLLEKNKTSTMLKKR